MTPKQRRQALATQINQEAALAYTDGPERQALYMAAWLLEEWRGSGELAERLFLVLKSFGPPPQVKLKRKTNGKRRA